MLCGRTPPAVTFWFLRASAWAGPNGCNLTSTWSRVSKKSAPQPINTAEAVERKLAKYFENGAREVWVAYPKTRRIWRYQGLQAQAVIEHDVFTSPCCPDLTRIWPKSSASSYQIRLTPYWS